MSSFFRLETGFDRNNTEQKQKDEMWDPSPRKQYINKMDDVKFWEKSDTCN